MNYSEDTIKIFRECYDYGVYIFKQEREQQIDKISPYSHQINVFIRNQKEVQVYTNLNLTEKTITRPSLTLDINPYFCDESDTTNLERMLSGKSPIDCVTGDTIDLHHIGQKYESPFAELPHSIHELGGNYSVLHTTKSSWRKNKELVRLTTTEIANYWRMRGKTIYEKL